MTPKVQIKRGLFLAVSLAVSFFVSVNIVSANVGSYQITDITWEKAGDKFTVRISGDSEPVFTMYELFAPNRIIVDIVGGIFVPPLSFPLQVTKGPVRDITGIATEGKNSKVSRVTVTLDEEASYSIKQDGTDLLLVFSGGEVGQEIVDASEDNYVSVTDIQVDAFSPEKATVLIYSSGPIGKFEIKEEEKTEIHSARLLINIPDVKIGNRVIPVTMDSPLALVNTTQSSNGGKITLDSADNKLFSYDIKTSSNFLELSISSKDAGSSDDMQMVALLTGSYEEGSGDFATSESAFLPYSEMQNDFSNINYQAPGGNNNIAELGANMNFSGYDEQKISVDFYKIDLHNVFRLIGEISNRNIVVDEAVSGSLTLSMKDVPWDFLLDVVLNLKDLVKEERFNTIVISPKSEEFSWPEADAATQLEVSVEPITVTKRLQTSKEKIDAKKLIRQASTEESKGRDVEALALYEEAYQLWPENGDLAKRISVIAMVKLGQNAKAAHYAKIAVQQNPQDYKAALIAAMSLGNMEKVSEAKEYFDLAVSGDRPAKHALASYAAFSEQNGSYDAALNMLDQYAMIYGNSLETMVSRARVYDQMGDSLRADEEYKAILLSGFKLPEDLKTYITNRVQ